MTILAGHGEKAMATSPENGFLQETSARELAVAANFSSSSKIVGLVILRS